MKLVKMSCPHCGGALEITENSLQIKCPYCNSTVAVDDEVKHIRFDNTMQAGYEFEKGRMKAQQDAVNERIAAEQARENALREAELQRQKTEPKKKHIFLWVIGWLFFFPITLTIVIARSKKLHPVIKVILIAALWIIIFLGSRMNR